MDKYYIKLYDSSGNYSMNLMITNLRMVYFSWVSKMRKWFTCMCFFEECYQWRISVFRQLVISESRRSSWTVITVCIALEVWRCNSMRLNRGFIVENKYVIVNKWLCLASRKALIGTQTGFDQLNLAGRKRHFYLDCFQWSGWYIAVLLVLLSTH